MSLRTQQKLPELTDSQEQELLRIASHRFERVDEDEKVLEMPWHGSSEEKRLLKLGLIERCDYTEQYGGGNDNDEAIPGYTYPLCRLSDKGELFIDENYWDYFDAYNDTPKGVSSLMAFLHIGRMLPERTERLNKVRLGLLK